MGQEFHVLRCFSCQTFQVQQVKKSKKWTCNMCGEKQSLIKEYGRGTGADCRRHVQKLNSLRGELLEVANERARTQWEKDEECDVPVGPGNETRSWQQSEHTQAVSRWSKYVDQKENGPGSEEDEGEVRVYTDADQRRQHRNTSRKRKQSFSSEASCGRDTADTVEDTYTAQWRGARLPTQPRRHNRTFKSSLQVPCSSTEVQHASISQRTDALCAFPAKSLGSKDITANKQSSELSTKPQHKVPLPSFTQQHSKTKTEAKDSKWARFLPAVCVEHKEEGDLDLDDAVLAQSIVAPVATVPPKDTGHMRGGGSEGALLEVFGVEKVIDFEKVNHCINGNVCKQPDSPTITSRPTGSQNPVCVQPLPTKRPCPAFSFNTLFHTDDDFDDAY